MPYRQGQILEDDQGNRVQLVGREWKPYESRRDEITRRGYERAAAETGPIDAALIAAGHALGGGWLYGDDGYQQLQQARPVATTLGGAAPAVLAGIASGGASAGLGTLGQMGTAAATEAAMGALGDPSNPLQSAALGGVIGGLGAGLVPGIQAGRQAFGRFAPGLAEGVRDAGLMLPLPQRVKAQIIRIADQPGGGQTGKAILQGAEVSTVEPGLTRQMGVGLMGSEEGALHGLQMTEGDKLYLDALAKGNRAEASMAQKIRVGEALRSDSPLSDFSNIRDSQKEWLTDRLAKAAGVDHNVPLTPDVIGQRFVDLGRDYDEIAHAVGSVPMGKDALGTIEEIVHQGAGSKHIRALEDLGHYLENNLNKNGGVLNYDNWQYLNHHLDRGIVAAQRVGDYAKLQDYQFFKETLYQEMTKSAPDELKAFIQAVDSQYSTLKLLTKHAGIVSPSGEVNVASLKNAYGNAPAAFKDSLNNDLKRSIDTVNLLQQKLVPDSGTVPRAVAWLAKNGGSIGASGAGSALGALGLMGLADWIKGN